VLDRELARGLIYTQRAMRLAQGNSVESFATSSSVQSAPQHGSQSCLTLQQKIKQFDASRRERWHEQIEVSLILTVNSFPGRIHVFAFNVFIFKTDLCIGCIFSCSDVIIPAIFVTILEITFTTLTKSICT